MGKVSNLSMVDNRVKARVMTFGVPNDMGDSFFTENTEIREDWYKERPLVFEGKKVGDVIKLDKTKEGYIAYANLTDDIEKVQAMISRDLLNAGASTLENLTKVGEDGEITEFPIIEVCLFRDEYP